MHRTMRANLALLLAAAALLGVSGAAEANQTVIKHQLVQQSNPSATSQGGASSQPGGQAQMGQAGNPVAGQLPQGVTPKDYGDTRDDVRDTLSSLANAALTRDNFNDLRDQLAKADRDRLSTNDNKYPEDLNRAIDQFRQAWTQKQNSDFKLDANQALGDQYLAATTGEVTNPQQVSQWPLPPNQQAAAQIQTSNPTMNQGTGVGVATFTGTPDQQPFHVSLVREGNDWKIDIPDTITADQLKTNLAQHLSQLANMQNQWPNDQNQIQRLVLSHVLMALYNLPAGQGGQQQQGQQQQGQQPQGQQQQGQQPQGQQPQGQQQQGQQHQGQQPQGQQPQGQQHQGQQPQGQQHQGQSSQQPQSSQGQSGQSGTSGQSTTSENPQTSATQSQSSSEDQNAEQSETEE